MKTTDGNVTLTLTVEREGAGWHLVLGPADVASALWCREHEGEMQSAMAALYERYEDKGVDDRALREMAAELSETLAVHVEPPPKL